MLAEDVIGIAPGVLIIREMDRRVVRSLLGYVRFCALVWPLDL
jgi:hypothetical protein